MNVDFTSKLHPERSLLKCPTGIAGFDEITLGGLPQGRPSLICGGPGCGKTLFGIEFLARGATEFGEPGVCISFEETAEDLAQNAISLGFDLKQLEEAKLLVVDYVHIDKSEIAETGEYDLEGLFIRVGSAIDSVGAKRVVLDTPEALFGGLNDTGVLRSELRRLFRWLKEKGVTAIITGERGEGTLTRHGIEEYVSDCVVLLDHRLQNGIVTRRLRVLKYRGSMHGTNEYPFLIGEKGISVLPVTSLGLRHKISDERISTGVPGLDEMLEGQGFYRGSSILMTGTAGTGKTSLAAHVVDAACARGEACLYFSFEESPDQLCRNMRSIGLDIARWVDQGLLTIHATRPSSLGLEMHLVEMHGLLEKHKPQVVVIDPLSSLLTGAENENDVTNMLLRVIDRLKQLGITGFFTALTGGGGVLEGTELNVSSLVDTWLLLRNLESDGERNRVLYVLKSRGMAHSNQLREFLMTKKGVELRDAYLGPAGVLTGSARLAQEAREREEDTRQKREAEDRRLAMNRKLCAAEAQILTLEAEKEAAERELNAAAIESEERQNAVIAQRAEMAHSRKVNLKPKGSQPKASEAGV
ncbi:MAG: circadian clock protein KaiC [Acidobacteriota bacterium]